MSQLKTNNIIHISNTGDPNIVLGDSGDVQVQSLNSGPLSGFRNQIINGDFRVWQRGDTFNMAALSNKAYTADRWYMSSTGGTVSRASGANPAPSGASGYALTYSGGTTPTLRQGIEVPTNQCGPFVPNSQWTLSWYSTSNTTGATVGFKAGDVSSQPLAGDRLLDNTTGTSIGANRYSATFTIPGGAVPTGTTMFFVMLFMSAGDTLSGVQLEPGPVATPFEHRPIGTELALCQRYYQKLNEVTGIGPVGLTQAQNTTRMVCFLPTKCTMRAAPSVGLPSTANFQLQVNDSDFGAMDFAIDQSCPSGVFVLIQPDPGNANRFTTGSSGRLFTVNANAGSFTADAEL